MIYTFRKRAKRIKTTIFFNLKKALRIDVGSVKGKVGVIAIYFGMLILFFKYLTTSITQDIMVAFDDDSFFDL